jgi:hypothetical protein
MSSEAVCALVQPRKQQQLPSFAVWQARQLWGRDLLFGLVLATILLLYFSKTVPKLCLEGSLSCPLQQQHAMQDHLLWRIICGNPQDPTASPSHTTSSILQKYDAAEVGTQLPAVGPGTTANHSVQQQVARLAATAATKLATPLVLLAQVGVLRLVFATKKQYVEQQLQ